MGNRMINARMETLAQKPAYRGALRSRRCLIPADGFYEWKRLPGGGKQPMHIGLKSQRPFAFAGLWERWRNPEGAEIRTCTIITGPANELVRPIHDRMPVILHPEDFKRWIDPAEREAADLLPILSPYSSAEMQAYPVGTKVNSPSIDTPECVERVDTSPPPREPGLFD